MKNTAPFFVYCLASLPIIGGCAFAEYGGNVGSSGKSAEDGTARVFSAGESTMIRAITNAFAGLRYRQMFLAPAQGFDFLVPGWHPTNGFVLEPFSADGSIGIISFHGRKLSYKAFFHIALEAIGTNETRVVVRTIISQVIEGKNLGIHATWANHYRSIPPVHREEDDVLAAIAAELGKEKRSQSPIRRDRDQPFPEV